MAAKKTVLITGCSDGSLGSALALAFHAAGSWRVLASARNLTKLQKVKDAGIECVQLDVQSPESIAQAVDEVGRLTGGALDALVNNAGIGGNMPVIHVDLPTTRDMFELNVFSVIATTQAFVPLLLKSTRNPLLVNNTTGQALLGCGFPFQGAYAASKAAAASFTESLRLELAPLGVRVVNLLTGGVKSGFTSNTQFSGTELPPGSIYNLAKTAIEAAWKDTSDDSKTDAAEWARQVVHDLSQAKPPYLVSRGAQARLGRLVTLLPTGTMDGTFKKMSGIDVLDKEIRAAGGVQKAQAKVGK
ncbi:NADPH-dependent 1-acyldihydroxyacetone phosphate reductase [Apiospora saccharicola]